MMLPAPLQPAPLQMPPRRLWRAGAWLALACGLLVVSAGSPVLAQSPASPSVALNLTASVPWGASVAAARVTAAIQTGASTAFDPGVDSPAVQAGPVQAWFRPPVPSGGPAAADLRRDVRGDADVWELHVATPPSGLGAAVAPGATVTLTWDMPSSGDVCGGRALLLADPATGTELDMTQARQFQFPAPVISSGTALATHVLQVTIGPLGTAPAGTVAAPDAPMIPRVTRRGVLVVWQPVAGGRVAGYQVERSDNPGDSSGGAPPVYRRLTQRPITEVRWLDAEPMNGAAVAYRIVAVSGSGCESAPSEAVLLSP
ncbi:MAG: hypothetical protein OEW11_08510 [Nitrospirota bacterium]|nr:hypothetical protein [Nitrospirota bacterium]